MELQKKFDDACKLVDTLFIRQERLKEELELAQNKLNTNTNLLNQAVRSREEVRAMMSVAPPIPDTPKLSAPVDGTPEDKQAVFQTIRKFANTWVAPRDLSVLSGIDEGVTAAILRRVSKIPGIPIEHNGQRGLASQYRWIGE